MEREEEKSTSSAPQPDNIKITERSDLSLLYKVLRTAIRPFRPRLVTGGDPLPAGSPRLQKHPRSIGKVAITERKIDIPATSESGSNADVGAQNDDVLWVYDFQAPHLAEQSQASPVGRQGKHMMYYFAGGGFTSPATSEHWKLCAHLASSQVAGGSGRIVLVSYPLAPHSPARDSLPLLRRWLRLALDEAEAENAVVSLLGDSAGANVAISLALWCGDQLAATARSQPKEVTAGAGPVTRMGNSSLRRLRAVLAISPPTDLRAGQNQNEAVARADARDPVLTTSLTDAAASAWTQGSDASDAYLSPNLADLDNIRDAGVQINGAVGTADVLAPEARGFLQRCREAGIKGRWLVWHDQMHCFPLAACYGLREGKEGRAWADEVLWGVR
ncbi:Alpha/Beta hydrolase protein [Xylariaceae sp. FL0804]|nr:Alpha/Beta hydrolase protein [Xylariaceae sp. FL0804]